MLMSKTMRTMFHKEVLKNECLGVSSEKGSGIHLGFFFPVPANLLQWPGSQPTYLESCCPQAGLHTSSFKSQLSSPFLESTVQKSASQMYNTYLSLLEYFLSTNFSLLSACLLESNITVYVPHGTEPLLQW